MEEKQKTEFQAWIAKVPHVDYARVRNNIMSATGVSRTTFASWCRGDTNPDGENKINVATEAYIYNKSNPFKLIQISDKEGVIDIHILQAADK